MESPLASPTRNNMSNTNPNEDDMDRTERYYNTPNTSQFNTINVNGEQIHIMNPVNVADGSNTPINGVRPLNQVPLAELERLEAQEAEDLRALRQLHLEQREREQQRESESRNEIQSRITNMRLEADQLRAYQLLNANLNANPNVSNDSGPIQSVSQNVGPLAGSETRVSTAGLDLESLIVRLAAQNRNSGPKPVVYKEPLPIFNGDPESSIIWLQEYESAAIRNNWGAEDKVRNLLAAFAEPVRIWYQGIYNGAIPTWSEF